MTITQRPQDPRTQYPEPPFPKQQQEPPGTEAELEPKADHGEKTYRGAERLTDRVALITGGDSGIGKAVAIAFAREGADVVISHLGGVEEADAADTISWVEKAGRKGVSIAGDIQDPELCRTLVERTVDELGRIDILVNNAAWQDCGDRIEEICREAMMEGWHPADAHWSFCSAVGMGIALGNAAKHRQEKLEAENG